MEDIYLVGTNHQNVIENRRIIDIVMEVTNPDQIYIESGGDESDIEISFLERLNKLDLSLYEKIASFFDCYAMRNLKDATPSFSEFNYAKEKAEKKSIPVVNIDKSKEKLVRESLKKSDKEDIIRYIYNQTKIFLTRGNIDSLFYQYAIGHSKSNNREKQMINEIKKASRKEKTVVFVGFAHVDYLYNKLEKSDEFNCKVIWNENERGTTEELKEYISSNLN